MVSVLPAEPADFERIAEIQHAAFSPSLINERIFSNVNPEDHRVKILQRLHKTSADPRSRLFKAVVDGELVAFALWEVPRKEDDPPADKKKEIDPDRWPAGTNVALAEGLFRKLDLGIETPHYRAPLPLRSPFRCPTDWLQADLSLLATDPARQRTGAGRALLQWGSKKADEEGVECYLEASEGACTLPVCPSCLQRTGR